MRIHGIGHILFAIGIAGLGILGLVSGDFPYVWEPVPDSLAHRALLAYCSGGFLLACAVGMFFRRFSMAAALLMTWYLMVWVFLLQAPLIPKGIRGLESQHLPFILYGLRIGATFLGACESLLLMLGAWSLFRSFRLDGSRATPDLFRGRSSVTVIRILCGFSCVIFGLSHLGYSKETGSMVPAWLPDPIQLASPAAHLPGIGYAYITAVGHLAAGIALLLSIVPVLAASCEALMITLFVVLLHGPEVFRPLLFHSGQTPGQPDRFHWTMLFVVTALAGAAWAVARCQRTAPRDPEAKLSETANPF